MNTLAAADEPIPIRRMNFEFTSDIPEHWGIDENPFLTALMAALSASFPAGERYFIQSVSHYVKQLDEEPELRERVRGFAGQEGQHTKEHLAFNRFLDARGMPVGAIEKRVEELIDRLKKRNTPAENLARTVALEHLTAFLAAAALENSEAFFGKMHPTIAAFWGWHLIEEFEHRSVAFDVYKRCVGDERLRVRAMAVTTFFFTVSNLLRTARVMNATGHRWNLAAWAKGLDLLFGRTGILRKMMPLYLAFYRPDFHPDQHQAGAELERARARFLAGREREKATS